MNRCSVCLMQAAPLAEGRAKEKRRDAGRRAEPPVRLRVLVADEQEIVHWGFRSLLTAQDWGERYIGAQTAEEALELVRAHEPHVAMVDVMVGDDPGAALCQSIRQACPRTRVLLMARNGGINAHAARAVRGFRGGADELG